MHRPVTRALISSRLPPSPRRAPCSPAPRRRPHPLGQRRLRAARSPKWTKISTDTSLGIASAGLFRTADGMLHVA